jgi:hypothetical protein
MFRGRAWGYRAHSARNAPLHQEQRSRATEDPVLLRARLCARGYRSLGSLAGAVRENLRIDPTDNRIAYYLSGAPAKSVYPEIEKGL